MSATDDPSPPSVVAARRTGGREAGAPQGRAGGLEMGELGGEELVALLQGGVLL